MNIFIYLVVVIATSYFNYLLYLDYKEGRQDSALLTFKILGVPLIIFVAVLTPHVTFPDLLMFENIITNIKFHDIITFCS